MLHPRMLFALIPKASSAKKAGLEVMEVVVGVTFPHRVESHLMDACRFVPYIFSLELSWLPFDYCISLPLLLACM